MREPWPEPSPFISYLSRGLLKYSVNPNSKATRPGLWAATAMLPYMEKAIAAFGDTAGRVRMTRVGRKLWLHRDKTPLAHIQLWKCDPLRMLEMWKFFEDMDGRILPAKSTDHFRFFRTQEEFDQMLARFCTCAIE